MATRKVKVEDGPALQCATPGCLYEAHPNIEKFKGYCCKRCGFGWKGHGAMCLKKESATSRKAVARELSPMPEALPSMSKKAVKKREAALRVEALQTREGRKQNVRPKKEEMPQGEEDNSDTEKALSESEEKIPQSEEEIPNWSGEEESSHKEEESPIKKESSDEETFPSCPALPGNGRVQISDKPTKEQLQLLVNDLKQKGRFKAMPLRACSCKTLCDNKAEALRIAVEAYDFVIESKIEAQK